MARESFVVSFGAKRHRYELTDHVECEEGIWMPRRVRNIYFDCAATEPEKRKRRVVDSRVFVDEISVNTLSERDFEFSPSAGALLTYDSGCPDADYPRQAVEGGHELLCEVARKMSHLVSKSPPPQVTWNFAPLLVALGIVVFSETVRAFVAGSIRGSSRGTSGV